MHSKRSQLLLPGVYVIFIVVLFFVLPLPMKEKLRTFPLHLLIGHVFGAGEYGRTKDKPEYRPLGTRKTTNYIVNPIIFILTITLFPPFIYEFVAHDLDDMSYYLLPFIAAIWTGYLVTMQNYRFKKESEFGEIEWGEIFAGRDNTEIER